MTDAHDGRGGLRVERDSPGPGAALIAFVVLLAIAGAAYTLEQRRGRAGAVGAGAAADLFPVVQIVDEAADLEAIAVAGGTRHVVRSKEFRKGDAVAVLGRSEIDFTGAGLAAGGGRIDTVVLFGRLDVKVPRGWTVVRDDLMIFSRFEDGTEDEGADPGQRLLLDGVVLFGAIEVTH